LGTRFEQCYGLWNLFWVKSVSFIEQLLWLHDLKRHFGFWGWGPFINDVTQKRGQWPQNISQGISSNRPLTQNFQTNGIVIPCQTPSPLDHVIYEWPIKNIFHLNFLQFSTILLKNYCNFWTFDLFYPTNYSNSLWTCQFHSTLKPLSLSLFITFIICKFIQIIAIETTSKFSLKLHIV